MLNAASGVIEEDNMGTTLVQQTQQLDSLFASCRESAQDPEFAVAKRWLGEHPGKKAIASAIL